MTRYHITSEFEWKILKSLWERNKGTVKQVWQDVFPNGERAYTTVQTYMERLVEKGILEKEKIGLVNFYTPIISEKGALDSATQGLVSRAFNGSFGMLATYLIGSQEIEEKDLEKIRKLLDEREKK